MQSACPKAQHCDPVWLIGLTRCVLDSLAFQQTTIRVYRTASHWPSKSKVKVECESSFYPPADFPKVTQLTTWAGRVGFTDISGLR